MQKVVRLSNLNSLYTLNGGASNSFKDRCEVFRTRLKDVHPVNGESLFNNGFKTDFFLVIRVLKGEVSVKLNNKEFVIGSNSILVATPHSLKVLSGCTNDCELEGVCFTVDLLKSLWPVENIENVLSYFGDQLSPYWQVETDAGSLISNLLEKLSQRLSQAENHKYGRELVAVTFSEFMFELAEIANKYTESGNFHYGRKEEIVAKFAQLGHKYYLQERKLSFYADQLHITPKHLSETVKEVTGKSAGKLLDDRYISEAKLFLENRELSISEISDKLNFTSPDIFSRFFQRMEGCSPSQYRKRFLKNNLKS